MLIRKYSLNRKQCTTEKQKTRYDAQRKQKTKWQK